MDTFFYNNIKKGELYEQNKYSLESYLWKRPDFIDLFITKFDSTLKLNNKYLTLKKPYSELKEK